MKEDYQAGIQKPKGRHMMWAVKRKKKKINSNNSV